jgi:solute:Na+ symporter, SSS family
MFFAATDAAVKLATAEGPHLPMGDLIVFIIYLAMVVGLGCFCFRFSKSSEGFMAAGRSLPGWAVGLSIFGTYVSSISFLANPGSAYAGNWNAFVFGLSLPIAALIAVKWFVPYYRKSGYISAYENLEDRFGPWARTYVLACYLLTQLARMGIIMYLVALVIHPLTGWSLYMIISVTGVLVTFYTLLGGIEAVVWTDAIQSIVLTLGAIVSIVVILMGMPEGPGQVFEIAWESNKFSLGSFGASVAAPTFWVTLIYGLFINLTNFGIDQSYVQRYITAKTDRQAGQSVWLGAMLYLPISALLFFIGTGLFAYYQVNTNLIPAEIAQTLKPDQFFPYFIAHQLPTGLTGLLIAAVFAAAMSSVDSSLNSSATLVLCDIYKRYIRPDVGEKESMRVLYTTTLIWGAVATAIGLILAATIEKEALSVWWTIAGVFSGGMLGLFLLGMISRTARNPEAIIAVLIGILSIAWMLLSNSGYWPESLGGIKSPFYKHMITVVATTTIVLVGLLLAKILGRKAIKTAKTS